MLVDVQSAHRGLYFLSDLGKTIADEFDTAKFPKRILDDARFNLKESGVNTLCLATGSIQLELNGKRVDSPILLTPITASIDRFRQKVSFQAFEDAAFVNPFLHSHLREAFEFVLPNDLCSTPELPTLTSYLEDKGLQIVQEIRVIGNFHHHRFEVLKELEEILETSAINPALGTLFGEAQAPLPPLDLSSTSLFPADTDHEKVFKQVSGSHTVIQGPPGTGKSQVICNLIGKALTEQQTILVASEKRAALEVIQSKLGDLNLDILSYIAGADRQSRDFLGSVKKTWDFLEAYTSSNKLNLRLSEQYEDHLQMTLDLLNQEDLIGGVSFHEFQQLSQGKQLDSAYSSIVPIISDFVKNKIVFELIFELGLQQQLSFLRKTTIESDTFLSLDQQIDNWQRRFRALQSVFKLESWDDLTQAMREAATCQVFENDLFKKYAAIFTPESKEQKRFTRLTKQYAQLSENIGVGSEWKVYPSLVEAISLQRQLKGSFFEKRAGKKRWKELSNLPLSEAASNLEQRIKFGDKEEKFSKCVAQLKKLGIHDPLTEIPLIEQSMSTFSQERWRSFLAIPADHRSKITAHHTALNDLFQELNSTFKIDGPCKIQEMLQGILKQLPSLLSERKNFLQLCEQELESLRLCATFESYESLVLGSNYTIFKERFPAFSHFDPADIHEKVRAILDAQSYEAQIHASHLINSVHKQFNEFHVLLNTPASKLKADQKALKKELRKGKSILIKEFRKTKSHPSLRELFLSEARHWISLLKPIWLSNPSSLAKCFPMEQNCFDLLIFDEASQIPLQHALGAIQRSRRIVVAGDEHQMGPSSYFQSGSKGLIDLLHQASYHFSKVHLLHHYRSSHPSLIAFSNKHFYEDKLSAYPSVEHHEHPIRHHFVGNAVFTDRTNLMEAKAIAQFISTRLTETKSMGIVAFSEEQLNCVWKQLDSSDQEKLIVHQEKHGGFFKALENVQGDECDRLVIGFGYAPNEQGSFHLRFGPMNTANGRKRLNVLLTRSRESIDFFCSVRSSDFKLSDNESINLLRQWIAFSEKQDIMNHVQFPHELQPAINGKTLTFHQIQHKLASAREVATLQQVLENRGWMVAYT